MLRLRLIAALAACSILLVGCGSDAEPGENPDSGSGAATASVDGATGVEIEGEGFTFNAPEGWEENDGSDAPSINFLAVALDPDDKDGFADNVNVIEDPTLLRAGDIDELEMAIEQVLSGVGEDVAIGDPTALDGEDAVVATATVTQAGATYGTVQLVATHDEVGYVVTFSFSEDRPAAERMQIAESVAASWSWAS